MKWQNLQRIEQEKDIGFPIIKESLFENKLNLRSSTLPHMDSVCKIILSRTSIWYTKCLMVCKLSKSIQKLFILANSVMLTMSRHHIPILKAMLYSIMKTHTYPPCMDFMILMNRLGVIWFVFHVLQLLPIRLHKNLCCISKSKIPDWKLDLPLFSCGYRKCMFVDFLIESIDPSSCVHYWV